MIDFIKTTAFSKNTCKEFDRPPKDVVLEDYPTDWRSALHVTASERMQEMEQKLKAMEGNLTSFVAITFAVMGVLVAALAVNPPKPLPSSLPTFLGLFAVTLSLITLIKGAAIPRADRKKSWILALWILCSAVLGGVFWWLVTAYCWPLR